MDSRFELEIKEENNLSIAVEPSFDCRPAPYIKVQRNGETICQFFFHQKEAEAFLEEFKKVMEICFVHGGDAVSMMEAGLISAGESDEGQRTH